MDFRIYEERHLGRKEWVSGVTSWKLGILRFLELIGQ